MNYFFPIEHFLNLHSKIKTLIIFSLFLNLSLYGQNLTTGGVIASNATICPGETPSTLVSTTPASGGGTAPIEYLWMTRTNFSQWSIAFGVNNQSSYSPPAIGITTYFIRCARRQGEIGYIESNTITITVMPNPTAHINEDSETVSVGTTISFSAAASSNSTYAWDFDGDGIVDCNTQNCSNTFTNVGTFTVTLSVNNGFCTMTDLITINVNPTVNSIIDPCDCSDSQNFSTANGFFVHDFILINSSSNEDWQIINNNSGAIFTNSGTQFPLGTDIPEITNSPGEYYLSFWFKSGDGYDLNLSNGSNQLSSGTSDPCSCVNPLPVELISFDAILNEPKNEVTLKWTTATETNNSHFEVQRSLDGSRFDFFEVVTGNGNSTLLQSYSLIDKNPISGVNYYRLKQVDFDGTQTYSNIVSAKISTESVIASVTPNPVKDIAVVRFGEQLPEKTKLQILSSTGQVMATYLVGNTYSHEINLDRFEKGIYFLRIKNAERKENAFFKIVKF